MAKKSLDERLLKSYSNPAKKIRRWIINLYRPIFHDKSTSVFNIDIMAYIMVFAFLGSAYMVYIDHPDYWIPFMSAWAVIPTTWIYLRLFPQTWEEMYDYEKQAFRELWRRPKDWEPKK